MQRARQAQVEAGVVDEHGERRPLAVHFVEHLAEHGPQAAQVAQHLDEPDDRELAHVGQDLRSLAGESVSAEAEHLEVRRAFAQVPDELARVQVARRLAGRDEEPSPRACASVRGHASEQYIR